MKNSTFIIIITASLALFGFGIFMIYQNESAKYKEQNVIGPNKIQLPTDPSFSPLKNDNAPFEAEITITPSNKPALSGRVQYNGKRTFRLELKQDGRLYETYITPEASIYCQKSGCYRSDSSESTGLVDTSLLIYEQTELNALGQGLRRTGETACGQNTCEVWESSAVISDGALSKVLLQKGTGNIKYVEGLQNNERFTISYDYKPVDIILPVRVEELSDQ